MIRIDAGQIDVSDGGNPPRTVIGDEEVVGPPPPPPRPRRRWRRRIARLAVFALLLLLLLIFTVQLVLWSNYPRTFVIAQLERQLGLRVQADDLSTTWWGDTTLTNVALSLPLGKDAFLRVPRMQVRHTSLVPLLLHWPLEVKAVTLHDPTLVVQQDRTGRWDILEVTDLVSRVGGSQQAQASTGTPATSTAAPASPATTVLPAITLDNGTVRILPWQSDPIEIHNIQLAGRPSGRLVWLYQASAGSADPGQPYAMLKGEVAPGGAWRHTLRAAARNLQPWVQTFLPQWPHDAAADISWEGAMQNGAVTGTADVESLHARQMDARGSIDVTASLNDLQLQPRTLRIDTHNPLVPRIDARGGSLHATRQNLTLRDLSIQAMGGTLTAGGQFSFDSGEGNAQLAWADIHAPAATLTGNATVTLTRPHDAAVDRPAQQLALRLQGRAATPFGVLDTTGNLQAAGPAWTQLAWNADLSRVGWTGWPTIEFTRLTARGNLTPTHLTLASLTAQGRGAISGGGDWNFSDNTWSATLHAENVPVLNSPATATLALDARGDRDTIHLQQATVQADGVTAEAAGSYAFALPQPLDLAVQLRETSFGDVPPPTTAATQPAIATAPDHTIRLQGKLRGNARLHGTLTPLNLDIAGRLLARNLSVRARDLGDLDVDVTGLLTENDLQLRTTEMQILGGRWNGSIAYPFATRTATVHVTLSDLPLEKWSDAFHWTVPAAGDAAAPLLTGTAAGDVTLEASGFDLAAMRGQGTLHIAHPQVNVAPGLPPVLAQAASARISLADGRIDIVPDIRQVPAAAPMVADRQGTLTGTLGLLLSEPDRLDADLHLQNWTLDFPGQDALLRVSSDLKGNLDLRTISGAAAAQTHTELWYRQQKTGDVLADATLAGRILTVSRVTAQMLTGNLNGSARVDLDKPLAAMLSLTWQDVDVTRLAPFYPPLADAVGISSGTLTVAPAQDPRALEPLKLTATLTNRGGLYRGIPIGNAMAEGYASATRLVLDRSFLEFAGGRLTFWGRTVSHDGRWNTSQFRIAGDALDLNQIVQAVRPRPDELVGKISGAIDFLGDPRRPASLSGGGTLTIENSDLANSDIIGGVYSVMHIGTGARQAQGRGRMLFRFEKGDAHITEMSYFNRGVQIRATGNIGNVLAMPNSTVDLVLAGTARPLRDVRLPVIADVDEIIGVLQSHVTTVRATGTVAEPRVAPVLLEQAGSDLREILLGEVRNR